MRRTVLLLASIVALTASASAQGNRRQANTPFGPAYNPTQSPEFRQAGGNYGLYLQIMERKALAARQKAAESEYKALQKQIQQAQKQQAAFEKWVKQQEALKAKGKPVDPMYTQMLDEQARYKAAVELKASKVAAKKSKKKSPTRPKPADEDAKPAKESPGPDTPPAEDPKSPEPDQDAKKAEPKS